MADINELLAKLAGQASVADTNYQTAAKSALEAPALDDGDIYGGAALGLLPLLIGGLLRGKKGLNIGAQAGMMGLGQYDKNIKEDAERKRKLGLFQAEAEGEKAKDARQSYQDILKGSTLNQQKEELKQETLTKFPRKGTNVTVNIPKETDPLSPKLIENMIAGPVASVQAADAALKDILTALPGAEKESYLDASGNFSFDKALDIFAQKGQSMVLGGATARGQAEQFLKRLLFAEAKEGSGLALTDSERKARDSIYKGEGILPAAFGDVISIVKKIREQNLTKAITMGTFSEELRRTPGKDLKQTIMKLMGAMPEVAEQRKPSPSEFLSGLKK